MRKIAFVIPLLAALVAFMPGYGKLAWAQDEPYYDNGYDQGYDQPYDQGDQYLLSPEELDDLVGPIALYPDPLIAQILPAATFVDQIDQAARYVREYGSTARIDDQPWDVSVKAVAHYPDVLFMMDQKYDWTVSLGQAYIEQPQDVMDAVQRLRVAAEDEGNLVSTPQQQVVTEADNIAIIPASPEYIYVPVYDPQVVYYQPYYPGYSYITYGSPFIIGAWLNRDCDWHRHRVYYHGWRERHGWVGRSRPHIHDRRGIYINRRAEVIHTNERVLRHDNRQFREHLRETTTRRLETRGMPGPATTATRPRPGRSGRTAATPGGTAGRQRGAATGQHRTGTGRERTTTPGTAAPGKTPTTSTPGRTPGTGTRQRLPGTTSPAPSPTPSPAPAPRGTATPQSRQQPGGTGQREVTGTRTGTTPSRRDVYRGRDVQKTQPASQSGYGGYGSGRDATIYHERGQRSREYVPHTSPRAPGLPRSYTSPSSTPSAVPRSTAPAPAAVPRPVTPAPTMAPAPRSYSPAPAAVPRSMPAPSAAPRSMPAPAPVSRPSAAPGGSIPSGMAPGGRR